MEVIIRILVLISDRCACQFLCADHFGACNSWTNPVPQQRSLQRRRRRGGGNSRAQSVSRLQQLKLNLLNAYENFALRRHYGAAGHGKFTGDGWGAIVKALLDLLIFGWLGNSDSAEAAANETPNAKWFVDELTKRFTKPKGAEHLWPSRRKQTKINGVYFHYLSPTLLEEVMADFRHYKTLKKTDGLLTKDLHELRFVPNSEYTFYMYARDSGCSCAGCSVEPPGRCVRTGGAGGSHVQVPTKFTLEEVAGADATDAADDGGDDDELQMIAQAMEAQVGSIVAFDVHDGQHNEEREYWLMELTKAPFILAEQAHDSRNPPTRLPMGTLVVEGHFLENVRDRRSQKLDNKYYVTSDTALLGYDVDGCSVVSTACKDFVVVTTDLDSAEYVDGDAPFLDDRRLVVPEELHTLLVHNIGVYGD